MSEVDDGKALWLANLAARSLTVRVRGARGSGALFVRSLDATSWPAAATGQSPAAQAVAGEMLTLAPFATVQAGEGP